METGAEENCVLGGDCTAVKFLVFPAEFQKNHGRMAFIKVIDVDRNTQLA